MTDTIIFDFDGTIAVGDGPIRAFARAIAKAFIASGASMSRADVFLADIFADLDIAGRDGFSPEDRDGYGLVGRHAAAVGIVGDALDAAYHHSRSVLATDEAPIVAPDGLRAFLDSLPDGVQAVLVTNAPATNIDRALDVLGLTGCFAEVHHSAGKPDGLAEIARPWIEAGRVLSVGDIWRNDLGPIAELGGHTALIGRPPAGTSPSFVAPTLEELLPSMVAWSAALAGQPA